jgi:hypothetical protein
VAQVAQPSLAPPRREAPAPSSGKNDRPRLEAVVPVEALEDSPIPSFRFSSAQTSKPKYVRHELSEDAEHLWEVFMPSRPQTVEDMFIGRRALMERIIRSIEEERAHIVIYGGRGLGKTSLGNIVAESARRAGYQVIRCACDSETSFESLFREFLKRLPGDLLNRSARSDGVSVQNLEQMLDSDRLGPTDLANVFGNLIERVILIIDEFDRVRDEDFKRKISEAIKAISDSSDLLTIMILGIGHTLDELLEQHISIQRQIKAIRLPLMEDKEILQLLRQGETRAGIRFDPDVRNHIVTLSKGTPYYVHLLALLAGRHALSRDADTVEQTDLRAAISDVLSEFDPNVVSAYDGATRNESKSFINDLLFAAAVSQVDHYGRFRAEDVMKTLQDYPDKSYRILHIQGGLSRLSKEGRRQVLQRDVSAGGTVTYDFVNPLMRNYIMFLQAERRGMLPGTGDTSDGEGDHRPPILVSNRL